MTAVGLCRQKIVDLRNEARPSNNLVIEHNVQHVLHKGDPKNGILKQVMIGAVATPSNSKKTQSLEVDEGFQED